jgi:hypothetical protein
MVRISSKLLIVTARRRCGSNSLPSSISRSVMMPCRSCRPPLKQDKCIGVLFKKNTIQSTIPSGFAHC